MRLQKPGFLRKYLVAASKFGKNPVSFVGSPGRMGVEKPGFLRQDAWPPANSVKTRFLLSVVLDAWGLRNRVSRTYLPEKCCITQHSL